MRWSIDLRWQSPKEKWGFYDIARGVVLRTAEEGTVTPDWDTFLKVDRKKVWQEKYNVKVRNGDGDAQQSVCVCGGGTGRKLVEMDNQALQLFNLFFLTNAHQFLKILKHKKPETIKRVICDRCVVSLSGGQVLSGDQLSLVFFRGAGRPCWSSPRPALSTNNRTTPQ